MDKHAYIIPQINFISFYLPDDNSVMFFNLKIVGS